MQVIEYRINAHSYSWVDNEYVHLGVVLGRGDEAQEVYPVSSLLASCRRQRGRDHSSPASASLVVH